MKRYEFTYKVTGYCTIGVEADSIEEAEREADEEFGQMDCGELWNADGEIIAVESYACSSGFVR